MSRLEGNAASGKAPKLVVDDGRELERERHVGEFESRVFVT